MCLMHASICAYKLTVYMYVYYSVYICIMYVFNHITYVICVFKYSWIIGVCSYVNSHSLNM